MSRIRIVAIGLFRRDGRILVAPGHDDVKAQRFFRPLGGAVEFGEAAADTLGREIREELGLEIRDAVRLGVLENRFVYRGEPGHEIVFVFDAAFVDERVYARDALPIVEPGWDGPATWVDPSALSVPLYPTGLDRLVAGLG